VVQGLPNCWGSVDRFLGRGHLALANLQTAERDLSEALGREPDLGAPLFVARTRLDQARLAPARGRAREAVELATEVAASAEIVSSKRPSTSTMPLFWPRSASTADDDEPLRLGLAPMTNNDDPVDLARVLEEQERRLVLNSFGYEDAWRLGCLLVEMARQRELPIVIDIRYGGQQLFHAALAGSSADNDGWVERKRRVAERYGHSSYLVGTSFRARGTTFEESSRLGVEAHAAHGGSFPLRVGGMNTGVIGTVTVSGLPQEDDHALVVEALERFLG
jgi:uncharacterized protein (UPF0303 family)